MLSESRKITILGTYRDAFFAVVEAYTQLKSTNGQSGCLDYSKSQERKPMYKNDTSFLSQFDFVIDVENAMKAVLTTQELERVKSLYINEPGTTAPVYTAMDIRVQEKLGKEFRFRKIYPIVEYFKGSKAA